MQSFFKLVIARRFELFRSALQAVFITAFISCVFATPEVVAQSASVTLDQVIGTWPLAPDTLQTGYPIEFRIRIDNQSGYNVAGITNGFRLYSPDGADHYINPAATKWNTAIDWTQWFDGGVFTNLFSGSGADTVGFGAFRLFNSGFPNTKSEVAFVIRTTLAAANSGKSICLDTSFYRPSGYWAWSASGIPTFEPSWDGPHCWDIVTLPCKNAPPYPICPSSLSHHHCGMMYYHFYDQFDEGLTFEFVSGPGSFNDSTGWWSYLPSLEDVGRELTLEMRIIDPVCGSSICLTDLTFTNSAPIFQSGCGYFPMYEPVVTHQIFANPQDCDTLIFLIESIDPPNNGISIDTRTGIITCVADSMAAETLYDVSIAVTDGVDTTWGCLAQFIYGTCQVPGDMNHSGKADISDLTFMVAYLFESGPAPIVFEEADIDGSGSIDITDLTYFVEWFFGGGPAPAPCP